MPERLFVGYPSAILYEGKDSDVNPPSPQKARKELLWGDELTLLHTSEDGAFHFVIGRKTKGWIKDSDTQAYPLLEIIYVDIGQGDGALVVTPNGKRYLIDAGQGDNMVRFLKWRFDFDEEQHFDAAIISHSDADHYGGFDHLFKEPGISFGKIYTNGIMERKSASKSDMLGPRVKSDGITYVNDLVTTLAELDDFLENPEDSRNKDYPTMLRKARDKGKFEDFSMLSTLDGHMPGHGPGAALEIEVLGPYPEEVDRKTALRWFGDPGRTKNGHSVVLRFNYGKVRIFMGGDLNLESGNHLLAMHTGLPPDPEDEQVAAAREIFECDIAKACHHGSADTLLPLLKAINPIATVVSSGDDEPHAHPRADAIGAIGKYSRGERPLILSTELARSAKETIKHPVALREKIAELSAQVDKATGEKKAAAQLKLQEALNAIPRSIAVYGAVNLRTDGNKVLLAYKLERLRGDTGWDKYLLEPIGPGGELEYISKH